MTYVYLASGLFILVISADAAVRGTVLLATHLHISRLVTGLFIVSFATSFPEIAIVLHAVLSGDHGLAVGNIIGSNIANILLVLGLAALIAPFKGYKKASLRDALTLLMLSVVVIRIAYQGELNRFHSTFFVSFTMLYVAYTYAMERLKEVPTVHIVYNLEIQDQMQQSTPPSFFKQMFWMGGGLIGLAVASWFLLRGAIGLAELFEVRTTIIGLSVMALSTSLPEIATVLVAASRGQPQLALGTVIGSNIFNILAGLGLAGFFTTVSIDRSFLSIDLWVLTISAFLIFPFLTTHWKLGRVEGFCLISAYIAYISYRYDIWDVLIWTSLFHF